ncbi:DJ-1-like protein [Chytriomyces sp. MP71]|nr:DJ-1-like protein [Chytriomyces sp. MP71]
MASNLGRSALVLVSDGSEEMETVIVVDTLRRANIAVTLASTTASRLVTCSRSVVLVADALLSELNSQVTEAFDAVVLPGGMGGATAFASSTHVHALLSSFFSNPSKLIAAVCAAPIAFVPANIGRGRTITSHPSVEAQLAQSGLFKAYSQDRVVVDGNLITSRGPGTCFEFALAIVNVLADENVVRTVAGPMMLHPHIQT